METNGLGFSLKTKPNMTLDLILPGLKANPVRLKQDFLVLLGLNVSILNRTYK